MRIHITNDNFKWFNTYKIHVILKLFYPWSTTQVKNDAKSLKYTGESQRTYRNTRIIVLWEVRFSEQCHWRLDRVFCDVTICRCMSSPQFFWNDTAPSFSASISPVQEALNRSTIKTWHYVPSKHQELLIHWHGITSHKAWMFHRIVYLWIIFYI